MNEIVRKLEELLAEAGGVDRSISCYGCGIHPSCEFSLQYGTGWRSDKNVWTVEPKNHQFGGWVDIRGVRTANQDPQLISRLCPSCVKRKFEKDAE